MGPELCAAVETGPIRRRWNRLVQEVWTWRLRRWLPRLVWIGDEVDVTITFTENRLRCLSMTDAQIMDGAAVVGILNSGAFWELERRLNELGIEFDKGLGPEGRDWEWDWSLRGPVRVKFRGRTSQPDRRR